MGLWYPSTLCISTYSVAPRGSIGSQYFSTHRIIRLIEKQSASLIDCRVCSTTYNVVIIINGSSQQQNNEPYNLQYVLTESFVSIPLRVFLFGSIRDTIHQAAEVFTNTYSTHHPANGVVGVSAAAAQLHRHHRNCIYRVVAADDDEVRSSCIE